MVSLPPRPQRCISQTQSLPLRMCKTSVTRGSGHGRGAAAGGAVAGWVAPWPPVPTLPRYDDCELLLLESRQKLSLSRTAALRALEGVQAGRLPCDGAELCARASAFTALPRTPGWPAPFDALRLLNESSAALEHDPRCARGMLVLISILPWLAMCSPAMPDQCCCPAQPRCNSTDVFCCMRQNSCSMIKND